MSKFQEEGKMQKNLRNQQVQGGEKSLTGYNKFYALKKHAR